MFKLLFAENLLQSSSLFAFMYIKLWSVKTRHTSFNITDDKQHWLLHVMIERDEPVLICKSVNDIWQLWQRRKKAYGLKQHQVK